MIKRLLLFIFLIITIVYLYLNFSEKPVVKNNTDTPIETPKVKEEVATSATLQEEQPVPVEEKKPKTKAAKIIADAKSYLGCSYKQGGTTKEGFDCSGLVMTSFAKNKVKLPRASYQMVKEGKKVLLSEIKPGDLLFFKTNKNRPNKISHVGLVTAIKNKDIYFIHSSTQKGVVINNLNEAYYKETFSIAKRVL